MDAKEIFTLGHVLPTTHPDYHAILFADNQWPDAPEFRAAVEAYYAYAAPGNAAVDTAHRRSANYQPHPHPRATDAIRREMTRLTQRVYALFAVALGLPREFFVPRTTATPMNSMNCIHYPPLPSNADPNQMGIGYAACAAHLYTHTHTHTQTDTIVRHPSLMPDVCLHDDAASTPTLSASPSCRRTRRLGSKSSATTGIGWM
jgi:isopenicillin N synthase-like dioxygenase